MKKLCLTLLCAGMLTGISNIVLASDDETMPPPLPQHEQNFEKHHEKMQNKLADDLQLSEQQRAKAKEMRTAAREKIKPLLDEMKALRQKMDTIRDENMKAFEEILTPEQKETFEKIKAERKAKHEKMKRHHRHHPLPPMPME